MRNRTKCKYLFAENLQPSIVVKISSLHCCSTLGLQATPSLSLWAMLLPGLQMAPPTLQMALLYLILLSTLLVSPDSRHLCLSFISVLVPSYCVQSPALVLQSPALKLSLYLFDPCVYFDFPVLWKLGYPSLFVLCNLGFSSKDYIFIFWKTPVS